jgi:hypothetical protein
MEMRGDRQGTGAPSLARTWTPARIFAIFVISLLGTRALSVYARELTVKKMVNGYSIEAALSQNPPILGKNDLYVTIVDHTGKNVASAVVVVNYFMPPMPGMPPMNYTTKANVRSSGYQATVDLIMKGPWNIVIRAGVAGQQLRMTVLIDVR